SKPAGGGLTRAIGWTPGDARLWREAGALAIGEHPAEAAEDLSAAISLDPYDAESTAALGLLLESANRPGEAERFLLKATRISNQLLPRLAVASFYYRTQRPEQFWQAAAAAAQVNAADLTPVFRLAAPMEPSPSRTATLLDLGSGSALAKYLAFLLHQPSESRVSDLAMRLCPANRFHDLLLAACDRLIQAGRTAEAVGVWNRLRGKTVLDPGRSLSLTDGGFELPESGGFDWKVSHSDGIGAVPVSPSGLRIEFSGHQAERLTLLEQLMPVMPGRRYRLVFRYRTSGLGGATGLRWVGLAPGAPDAVSSQPIEPVDEGTSQFDFQTGADTDLLRLALFSQCDAGMTRIEGTLTLLSAELRLQ
ncbi:MAG: hypothetical protein WBL61_08310, partial [Bryobacteraceae bacterium]